MRHTEPDVDRDTSIQNIKCVVKLMHVGNKRDTSKI